MKVKYISITILAIFACIFLINITYKPYINQKQDENVDSMISTQKGIAEIKKLELKNVVELEKKIDNMNKKNLENRDFKSIFSNSVIMGDSISEALTGYEILNKSSVVAVKGRNTSTAMKDIKTAVNLQPANIFLTYGMNDLLYFNGNVEKFINQYKKMIKEIKEKLPQTNIYISGILPMQKKAIDKHNAYGKFNEFNEELNNLCEEYGFGFIETKNLLSEDSKLYENDGIHMKIGFYPIWLNRLAEAANL